jgi:hypothetical protein
VTRSFGFCRCLGIIYCGVRSHDHYVNSEWNSWRKLNTKLKSPRDVSHSQLARCNDMLMITPARTQCWNFIFGEERASLSAALGAHARAKWKKERERERYNISTTMLSVMIPLHYLITAPKIIWLFCAVYSSARRGYYIKNECELLCGLFLHECGVALFLFIYLWLSWFNRMDRELRKRTASRCVGETQELLLFYWPDAPAHLLHSAEESSFLTFVQCYKINAFNFC